MRKKILSRESLSTIVAVMLIAVVAALVLASPATATRVLPASVTSGAEFDVTIEASGCGAFGQVVETLPSGFTYLSCTPGDIGVEQLGNTVKFTFLGDSASFTYTLRATTVADIYIFNGIVKDGDLNQFDVTGDTTITVTAPAPVIYTLTMAVSGNGATTPPVGSHIYDDGTVLDINVTAASGWRFDHWSGNVADPDSSSTTVTMDSNKTVTAYFTQVSGTRALPASVVSEAEFDVAIEASGCGFCGQIVETLPSGFTYLSCTPGDIGVEQIGNTLKFSFLGDSASFAYRAKAPRVTATTTYTFHGVVRDEDRISHPIEDDDITVLEPSGTRTLPASVASGAEFDVAIEASGCGIFGQVVESLPSGFAYVSSSLPADQVEQMDSTVKFTFLEAPASFTYRVKTARVTTTTTYTLHGVVKDEDRISYPIEDNEITVASDRRGRGGGGGGGGSTASPTTTIAVGSINIAPYLDALNKIKRELILKSTDDKIVVTIPKGTKVSVTSLSAAIMPTLPLPPADHILVGSAYELKPDGATFAAAVTVAISYDVNQISKSADELVIACYDKESENWQKLTTIVDTTAHKATASVAHFTPFAILARLPAAPAAFSISNLSIQPVQVQPNEAATISVLVTNIGGTEGSYVVVPKINGLKETEKTITVAAGGSQIVTFSVTKEASGSYTVTVDGLSSSFTVATPPLVKGINWPLTGGIIAGVIIVGLLIFFLVRRRV